MPVILNWKDRKLYLVPTYLRWAGAGGGENHFFPLTITLPWLHFLKPGHHRMFTEHVSLLTVSFENLFKNKSTGPCFGWGRTKETVYFIPTQLRKMYFLAKRRNYQKARTTGSWGWHSRILTAQSNLAQRGFPKASVSREGSGNLSH